MPNPQLIFSHPKKPYTLDYLLDKTGFRVISFVFNSLQFFPKFPEDKLGKGTFGQTTLFFHSASSNYMAVKTPLRALTWDNCFGPKSEPHNEIKLLSEIYPDDGNYFYYAHELPAPEEDKSAASNKKPAKISPYYAYALFIPYFPGTTVYKTLLEVNSQERLIVILLAFFKELHRIHGLGITHGDPHFENAIISASNQIRFFDFAIGSKGADSWASTYIPENIRNTHHIAYERIGYNVRVFSQPNQDIFGFGMQLRLSFLHSQTWSKDINDSWVCKMSIYPSSVLNFCEEAISAAPSHRPNLDNLISELEHYQAPSTDNSIRYHFEENCAEKFTLKVGSTSYRPFKTTTTISSSLIMKFLTSLGPMRVKFHNIKSALGETSLCGHMNQRKLYPPRKSESEYKLCSLEKFPFKEGSKKYSFFEISPWRQGVNLLQFVKKLKTELQFCRLALAILVELERTHTQDHGYFHGNLRVFNIFIFATSLKGPYNVDIGNYSSWGYRKDSRYASAINRPCLYWPEERTQGKSISPDARQEYRLAAEVFHWAEMDMHSELINEFCQHALHQDPEKRPRQILDYIAKLRRRVRELEEMEINQAPQDKKAEFKI